VKAQICYCGDGFCAKENLWRMWLWPEIISFRRQTSTQELALAKALKPSKKFVMKTSAVGPKAAGKKTFYTSAGESSVTRARNVC
jgi:hypothetical protein